MYHTHPFGDPDGSRAQIDNIMEGFITSTSKYFPIQDTNMRTRIIVGAKGSGKTLYLRRMQIKVKEEKSVYVGEIANEPPSTSSIIRFSQLFDINTLTEKWMLLWRCALLRSLSSHILGESSLRSYLNETDIKEIRQFKKKLLFPKAEYPMDPYEEARNILSYLDTKEEFNEYFSLREWDELDHILGKLLSRFPPIYFFLDCIDDEYGHAPMYWMRCQKGLFYRCMRFLRHPIYGNKFHLVICVRDQVISSVYQSEHSTRYLNDSHVLSLDWSYRSIEYFFITKISRLQDCFFMKLDESHGKQLSNWLGISTITNVIRDIKEPLMQYILRHTRLSPRDIVDIGNALSAIMRESSEREDFDIEAEIRSKVSTATRAFGKELLSICANQINNNQMPDTAGKMDYSEVYTSVHEYVEQTSNKLCKILGMLPSDRFTWNDIEAINSYIKDNKNLLTDNHYLFDVLWQNGAIGYTETAPNGGEEEIFFVDCNYEHFTLPKEKKQYLLRTCLLDFIGSPIAKSKKPVIGGSIK